MTEQAITANTIRPGDLITLGTLPNGTVATVEVHNWTVTVTYLDGSEHFTSVLAVLHVEPIADRLEELRASIDAESISWGEIHELQNLARFIDPSDYELLSWAGVTEDEDDEDVCSHPGCTNHLDDGEGYDGYCGTHADLNEQEF